MLCRTLPINIWKQKYFTRHHKENWPKAFVTFSRLWPERGWGWGKGVNLLKRKICDEKLFQIVLNEILESCKNNICWYKNWCKTKQETKKLVAVSYNFSPKYLLKTWNLMQNRLGFFISSWLAFHAAWYCPLRTGKGGRERVFI